MAATRPPGPLSLRARPRRAIPSWSCQCAPSRPSRDLFRHEPARRPGERVRAGESCRSNRCRSAQSESESEESDVQAGRTRTRALDGVSPPGGPGALRLSTAGSRRTPPPPAPAARRGARFTSPPKQNAAASSPCQGIPPRSDNTVSNRTGVLHR